MRARSVLAEPVMLAGLADEPLITVPFVDSMLSCQELALRLPKPARGACRFLPTDIRRQSSHWIWLSDNGAIVNRNREGNYRLTSGSCITDFCRSVECAQREWPVFACDDARTRKMSAPDFETLIFDSVKYKRTRSE